MAKERASKGRPGATAKIEQSRDMYGFMVRPQHLERYLEYRPIYKEEEAERSERWDQFLDVINEDMPPVAGLDLLSSGSSDDLKESLEGEDSENGDKANGEHTDKVVILEPEHGATKLWAQLRKSLWAVERASTIRGRGLHSVSSFAKEAMEAEARRNRAISADHDPSIARGDGMESAEPIDGAQELPYMNGIEQRNQMAIETSPEVSKQETSGRTSGDGHGEDSEDEFLDATEGADLLHDGDHTGRNASSPVSSSASPPEVRRDETPWEEELRSLVRGGVPMALRGELWQVFVGTRKRRAYGHYNALLTLLADGGGDSNGVGGLLDGSSSAEKNYLASKSGVLEKWTTQIEKDLPRTFPGHPALDEDGRNALRRLLTAYARHNPSVGYCQAMNFLAALLLLLMPEENAFWTLTGIIDDYFEGYYSEKMLEAQVDQLVFEELVREHFPKLVNHLDALGVQVAWVSGPWFLSIFVNVLPWESVLRVWDVLLFEGNRCMLFRTALALMEIHAPDLAATRDAGDAVALLQSMASATFDSSHLVLIACMGFQTVTEARLQKLRVKHRPEVLAALQERSVQLNLWKNSKTAVPAKIASAKKLGGDLPCLYSKEDSSGHDILIKEGIIVSKDKTDEISDKLASKPQNHGNGVDQYLGVSIKVPVSFQEAVIRKPSPKGSSPTAEDDEIYDADLQEQVLWLKQELCRALEEQKAATLRAEELETALVEMVKMDNRRLLAAKVEKLEADVATFRAMLTEKQEQEEALVQVLVRMENEQRIADDARRFAEKDAAAQRRAAELLQAKYEGSVAANAEMEKRAVMAESMLEATLSYQSLGNNSPHGSFRRSSMDPSLLRTSETPHGSPLVKEESGKSRSRHNGTNGVINEEQWDEKASKQGFFSRQFAQLAG